MYKLLKRPLSIAIILGMLAGVTASASGVYSRVTAPEINTSIVDAAIIGREETVYTVLQPDGGVYGSYCVISLSLDKAGRFMDFGTYDTIKNLTTAGEIAVSGNAVSAVAPDNTFIYQGNAVSASSDINGGFLDFDIRYRLNGEPVSYADLLGKTGKVESEITLSPRPGDDYFAKNYIVQLSISLPVGSYGNVNAESASIASVGGSRTLRYTVSGGSAKLSWSATAAEAAPIAIEAAGVAADVSAMIRSSVPNLTELTDQLSALTAAVEMLSGSSAKLDEMIAALQETATATGANPAIMQAIGGIKSGSTSLKAGLDMLNRNVSAVPDQINNALQSGEPIEYRSFTDTRNNGITSAVTFVWKIQQPTKEASEAQEESPDQTTLWQRILALFE